MVGCCCFTEKSSIFNQNSKGGQVCLPSAPYDDYYFKVGGGGGGGGEW